MTLSIIKNWKQKLFVLALAAFTLICWRYVMAEDLETATSATDEINNAADSLNVSNESLYLSADEETTTSTDKYEEEALAGSENEQEGEGVTSRQEPDEEVVKHDTLPREEQELGEDELAVKDDGEDNPEIEAEITKIENANIETDLTTTNRPHDAPPASNPSEPVPPPLENLIDGRILLSEKILISEIECRDRFITFLIYKNGVDWTKNPEKYLFNKAFDCVFPIIIVLDSPVFENGNYILLKADQGESGAWYNPQILTDFSVP